MPALSRLIEMHYVRRTAVTLLDTYLGKQTGQKVLNGQVRRGDGDNIYSVIWFCDLRNSTALSETMAREDFLVMLNQFLEAMADAVLDAERVKNGENEIGFGIGLHLGEVTYGNIGSLNRLEFTVIGAAANEAARLESLTKEVAVPIIISENFNSCSPSKLKSLGRKALRNVEGNQEIFTLPDL
jgi:adenylate cyclase